MYLRFPLLCGSRLMALAILVNMTGGTQLAWAEKVATEKWNISADKVIRYEKPDSIVAQGNVVLEKNQKVTPRTTQDQRVSSWAELLEEKQKPEAPRAEQVERQAAPQYQTTVTIKADWMVYDVEMESIKAKGNVHIVTNEEELFAREATVSLPKETGKFTDATILRKELSLHLEGKSVEKTGFDTYRIGDGWVITCKLDDGETPPWSFSAANTEVRQGGYAVLTHARFNIKDVPVFYTPYMILPAKNTRQSGFLFPYISSSSLDGFGLNVPFFLNISDSVDATFYPEYRMKRGFMPGADFRYMSSSTNKGTFSATFLDDELSDPSETDYYQETGYTHDNNDRYWIRGKADHIFADVWQTRLDIDIVSDQDYLNEFNSGPSGYRKSYDSYFETFGRSFQNQTELNRQNSLKTLRSFKGMSLEANLLAINETNTNASDSNTPLWKLPSVGFSGALPFGETNYYLDWNTSYVNYWREDGVGGHRVDLKPAISAPIPISPYLETLAQVSLRETFYYVEPYGDAIWEEDQAQNRILPEYKVEVATTLERDFSTGEGELNGFTHQVRPFVKYEHIPGVDQITLPKWDDVDQIIGRNALIYGVDNFFNPLSTADMKRTATWDAASLRIEQAWDLRTEPDEEPLSAVYGKLGWSPFASTRLLYKTAYDVYENIITTHSFGGQVRNSRGDQFGLDYSFKDKSYTELGDFTTPALGYEIEQINASFRSPLPLFASWLAGGTIEHSISQDETIKANGFLTYMAKCWSLTFETQYTPADTTYVVFFNLANIGTPFGMPLN